MIDAEGNTRQPISQTAGSYVVQAEPGEDLYAIVSGRQSELGQYVLDVNHYHQDTTANDVDGDTLDSATPIKASGVGVDLYRTIDSPTDIDVFQFHTPTIRQNYVFLAVRGTTNQTQVEFEVLDADGNVVNTDSDSLAARYDWLVMFDVFPDEDYFVRVVEPDGNLGEYSVPLGINSGSVQQFESGGNRDPDSPSPISPTSASRYTAPNCRTCNSRRPIPSATS